MAVSPPMLPPSANAAKGKASAARQQTAPQRRSVTTKPADESDTVKHPRELYVYASVRRPAESEAQRVLHRK